MAVGGSLIRRCPFSQGFYRISVLSVYHDPTLNSFIKYNAGIRSTDLHLNIAKSVTPYTLSLAEWERVPFSISHTPLFLHSLIEAVSTPPPPPSSIRRHVRDCHAPVDTGTQPSFRSFLHCIIYRDIQIRQH